MAADFGGQLIRHLRIRAGRTQTELELAARLGEHYLKRIELGQVTRPQRATLERILKALHASYDDQRLVLEAYGYTAQNPLPTADEIALAQQRFRASLTPIPIPVQLLDCAQRLLDWNRLLPPLVGRHPDDPAMLTLTNRTITEILYEPAFGIGQRVLNLQAWSRHMLPVLIHELRPYLKEPWGEQLYVAMRQNVPGLADLIDDPALERAIPARPLEPIVFAGPADTALPFRIAAEPFTEDTRFRVIYYFPADAAALNYCQAWRITDGGL
jgi:transcriptional regulator with XRE-family HTH domain